MASLSDIPFAIAPPSPLLLLPSHLHLVLQIYQHYLLTLPLCKAYRQQTALAPDLWLALLQAEPLCAPRPPLGDCLQLLGRLPAPAAGELAAATGPSALTGLNLGGDCMIASDDEFEEQTGAASEGEEAEAAARSAWRAGAQVACLTLT